MRLYRNKGRVAAVYTVLTLTKPLGMVRERWLLTRAPLTAPVPLLRLLCCQFTRAMSDVTLRASGLQHDEEGSLLRHDSREETLSRKYGGRIIVAPAPCHRR